MGLPWFRRAGLLFIPVSAIGWMLGLLFIGYAVRIFLEIDARSHSVSDTLINFVPNAVILALVYSLVALLSSKKRNPAE